MKGAYINDDLIDRVDWINKDTILHDDTWKSWEKHLGDEEALHLSDFRKLYKIGIGRIYDCGYGELSVYGSADSCGVFG